ncbi:MAG: response regulator [Planctomycetes bacterium]|nr:response regulator [Planctomycetota bacterium]
MEANILVVDDEEVLGSTCRQVLANAGYRTTLSRTPAEALREAARTPFDVVCIDVEALPALREIRDKQPWLEVIAVTRHPSIDEVKIAVRLGASELLAKPVSPAALLRLVAQAIERKAWSMRPCALEEPPAGRTPEPDDCRLTYEGAGLVTIGLNPRFADSSYVELPLEGALIARGEPLVRVLFADGSIRAVASPVSGRVARAHDAVMRDSRALRRSDTWALQLELDKE